MSSVNLWAIGNCQTSALIDRGGRMVWACVPRVDGDPLFSALLGGDDPADGFWSVEMEDAVEITQSYRRNTPVLITRQSNGDGNVIEVVDFCPVFPPQRPSVPCLCPHHPRDLGKPAHPHAPAPDQRLGQGGARHDRGNQPYPLSRRNHGPAPDHQRAGGLYP
jgi:hypothetical protein